MAAAIQAPNAFSHTKTARITPSHPTSPAPPSSPSLVASPIHALPPELLFRCLELGAEDVEATEGKYARRAFLSSTSTVCHMWSGISQELLWRKVDLHRKFTPQMLLDNPQYGTYQIHELCILADDKQNISANLVLEVLASVKGLRQLSLAEFEWEAKLGFSIFSSPNLKGLSFSL